MYLAAVAASVLVCVALGATALAVQDVIPTLNAGGVSSGVDPVGIRRSTNYAVVDSIGQFVVSSSASLNCQIEHGYWSSEPEIIVVDFVSEAKNCQDGRLVEVTGKVVTAGNDLLASRFYIEETDRSSGLQIRYGILGGPAVVLGNAVNVAGRLSTIQGERVLELPYVEVSSSNEPIPDSLVMRSRDAGGEALNQWTPGVWRGLGANNVGLLVTEFGRVTYRDVTGGFFYLDDGSTIDDGAGWGIRVVCSDLAPGNTITIPAFNKFVSVSGIMSTTVVDSQAVRCIRPREQSDILVIR